MEATENREILSIARVGDEFSISYDDGTSSAVGYDDLPDNHAVVIESPVLEGISSQKCPMCFKGMTMKYSYRWPLATRGGKIVEYDRNNFFENCEGYRCDACGKVKIFGWEVRNEDRVAEAYRDPPDWYIRYEDSGSIVANFAINDRSGVYRCAYSNGEIERLITLRNSDETDSLYISLGDVGNDEDTIGLLYDALGEAIQEDDFSYVIPSWE